MSWVTKDIVPTVLVSNDELWLPYALEATRGLFGRWVIYDVGSTDGTRSIIDWWVRTNPDCDFYVKIFPMVDPKIQGSFRNSMIAESLSDSYLILDGDECWNRSSIEYIANNATALVDSSKPYGVVRRIEVAGNLTEAYGTDSFVRHHRIYNRNMIWTGSHPGEVPYFDQTKEREKEYQDLIVYHFHNCQRSSMDHLVPKRIERRSRTTYRPGNLAPINIFEKLPILKTPIENFPVNNNLKILQDQL